MEQRKILFKAKRLDNGELVEGSLIHKNNGVYIYNPQLVNKRGYSVQSIKVDPATVCQFTGFEDMNHNKVYEHDIVRNIQTGDEFELIWHNSLLGFYFYKEGEIYERQGIKVIIVGNKFDRKEGEK